MASPAKTWLQSAMPARYLAGWPRGRPRGSSFAAPPISADWVPAKPAKTLAEPLAEPSHNN
jgi:hypothetical protein